MMQRLIRLWLALAWLLLPIPAGAQVLSLTDGTVATSSAGSLGSLTLTITPLGAASGGTGLATYAIGDLITATAATTLGRVADVAVNQVLTSGGVGVVPAWSGTPTVTSLTATTSIYAGSLQRLGWTARSVMLSGADGRITLANAALNDFTRLTFGVEAATHPSLAVSAAVAGQTQGIILMKGDGTTAVFANLGAATNGSLIYCSDCAKATPCAGAGGGALAKRLNGAWDCD